MSPSPKPDCPEAHLIDTADGFAEVCGRLSEVDRFGFDVEFVAEEGYGAEACLLQVATEERVWLIDPLAGFGIEGFWLLVSDERITKVVHAGLEDLAMCFHQTGEVPRNVFDAQIAAGLVDLSYPLSLQRLLQAVLGVRLRKTQTLTNWRKRPLTPEQIQYAVRDVAYLLATHQKLKDRLDRRDRTDWAEEEFARFSQAETYHREEQELWRRVRGAGSLDRRGLAIVRELAIERDALAREFDRPARAVLKDHLMIAISRHGLSRSADLRSLRGLSLRNDALARISRAVERARRSPPEEWPKQIRTDADSLWETALRKLISAVLTDFCDAEGIAPQLLWTNKDVRALVLARTRNRDRAEPGTLQRGWRHRAVGRLLDDVLEGRRAVRVVGDQRAGRLVIE